MIDRHVHLAALPEGKNGCFIAPQMLKSWLFRRLVRRLGLSTEDPVKTNELYIQRLVRLLQESHYVRQAVLLGMDGVYDAQGELDSAKTEFLIPNDYVFATVSRYPRLFRPGVSINPQRRDAIVELQRCASRGAALVKVLPNSQQFNPANPDYVPFYKEMARLKIPLLCHVGYEFSLRGKDQSLGDPIHLRLPLEQDVQVIAAHGMSTGLFFRERYWNTLLEFVQCYPHFKFDGSALTLPSRVGMLLRLRRHPELHSRMVFGTDYPLPQFAYPAILTGHVRGYLELCRIKNPFDRYARLLEILGFEKQTDRRGSGFSDDETCAGPRDS